MEGDSLAMPSGLDLSVAEECCRVEVWARWADEIVSSSAKEGRNFDATAPPQTLLALAHPSKRCNISSTRSLSRSPVLQLSIRPRIVQIRPPQRDLQPWCVAQISAQHSHTPPTSLTSPSDPFLQPKATSHSRSKSSKSHSHAPAAKFSSTPDDPSTTAAAVKNELDFASFVGQSVRTLASCSSDPLPNSWLTVCYSLPMVSPVKGRSANARRWAVDCVCRRRSFDNVRPVRSPHHQEGQAGAQEGGSSFPYVEPLHFGLRSSETSGGRSSWLLTRELLRLPRPTRQV